MNTNLMIASILGVLLLAIAGLYIFFKRPRKLKTNYYQEKWQELQELCSDKTKWGEAILKADQLLDSALKRRRLSGKSMGERLVSAQRLFTDNDSVWYGHKLRKQLDQKPNLKLGKVKVKNALIGLRQALKDLGALK